MGTTSDSFNTADGTIDERLVQDEQADGVVPLSHPPLNKVSSSYPALSALSDLIRNRSLCQFDDHQRKTALRVRTRVLDDPSPT